MKFPRASIVLVPALLAACAAPEVRRPAAQPVAHVRFAAGQKAILFKGPQCDQPEPVVPGPAIAVPADTDFAFELSGALKGQSCSARGTLRLGARDSLEIGFSFAAPYPCRIVATRPAVTRGEEEDTPVVNVTPGIACRN